MVFDVFISNSRRDYAIVQMITKALDAGNITYFIDQQGIESGSNFAEQIIQAINKSRLFLCVLSNNAYHSDFLRMELSYALQSENIVVLPVIVDNSELPDEFVFRFGNLDILHWQFNNNLHIEDTITRQINHALGRNVTLSEAEKENNIESAIQKQNGSDDYIPHPIDIDVFISYRRVDGRDYARNVMQGLKIVGYPKIFFDYNSIRDGIFNTQIIDAIYSCKDFILIISPLALKNCAKEGDWVTKEIREAIKYNKHIIPVVIEDTFKGWPSDFPEDLAPIKNIQFHKLMTDEYFEDSIQKLANRLTCEASETSPFSLTQDNPSDYAPIEATISYKIKVNKKCRLLIDDEEIQVLEPFVLSKIALPKGEYIRKVVDFYDTSNYSENVLELDRDRAELINLV